MPVLALQIKAELENITDLIPADADHTWHFKVQCTGCREVDQNWITMNAIDKAELSSGRGEANLVMKCKFCKRESSADFSSKPVAYEIENNDKFATIVTIECRGLEPVDFEPRMGWKAKGAESGTVFDEVDLSEGDWAEYDDKSELPVAISNIEAKFVKVNQTEEAIDIGKEPISTTHGDTNPPTLPTSFNTPFLGLCAKLSLSFATPTVIYLLFSAWHLYRARSTVQSIVLSTKETLVQNCQDLERSISTLASFPDIAAEAAHHALAVGIESAVEQISQGLQIMLQGILETIEFIVTFLTGTWRCFLVHLASSGIPLISDIGDGGVQAIDQLTATLMGLLNLPFNELGVLIQQEMNTQGFRESIAKISVQPMDKIEFCAGTVGSLSVDALTADFKRWILYGTLGIVAVAVLMTCVNMGLIASAHRRWKVHLQRIMLQLPKIDSAPTLQHASHVSKNDTKDLEVSDATTSTVAKIDQLTHHPLIFRFVDATSRRLFPTHSTNRNLFLWFITYITHPPALTCLMIGCLGLLFVYTQIALFNYARTHYRPLLLQPLTTLSRTVLLQVHRGMARSSAQFAADTNAEIARLESTLNAQVFNAIVRSAGEMASALEQVQTSLTAGVQDVFGGLFGALVMAVLSCLLLNKLDNVRQGLVWVEGHAQMRLPRLAPEVLVVSQARVYQMVKAMMAQTAGQQQEGQGQGQEQVGVVVARILAQYEDQLREELPVYYGLVLVWGVVVGMGVAGVCFKRREMNKIKP
ncbi:hypothetical protein BGZ59_005177 [Podila verticillata]|nr:hypothetical protein BGZ59_005177 [Podila verticillata]